MAVKDRHGNSFYGQREDERKMDRVLQRPI